MALILTISAESAGNTGHASSAGGVSGRVGGDGAIGATGSDTDVEGFDFTVPNELSAREPAEARGVRRDQVRMLVGRRADLQLSHHVAADLPQVLRPGDLLVVNNSGTLPAALEGRLPDGTPVALHVSSAEPGAGGEYLVELRRQRRGTTTPFASGTSPARPGLIVDLPGGAAAELTAEFTGRLWYARFRLPSRGGEPGDQGHTGAHESTATHESVSAQQSTAAHQSVATHDSTMAQESPVTHELVAAHESLAAQELATARESAVVHASAAVQGPTMAREPATGRDLAGQEAAAQGSMTVARYLARHGKPIRYSYVDRDWPLSAYQTVFAVEPGSSEMPSAARPFTPELVAALVARGILIAPITLHTGVASPEAHEAPYAERYRVTESTARLVNHVRASGGRVIAVGTTVVRALESTADDDGRVHAADGWTELVITPQRGVRAVDGLLTGWHEPRASHLLMLEAVAGRPLLDLCYAEAIRERYLWHEFGDVNLLLDDKR